MIGIYSLYKDFEGLVNTFQGGFFPPHTVFTRNVNDIQLEIFNEWVTKAEKSQEAKDMLFPFLKSQNVICKQQPSYYSIAQKPSDYGRLASCKVYLIKEKEVCVPDKEINGGKCIGGEFEEKVTDEDYAAIYESSVENIDNQRWENCLKHLTKMPTFDNPKMTQVNNSFKVAPRTVGVIILNYYALPTEAVFGYTMASGNVQTGAGGQIIFDQNKSRDLQWEPTMKPEFLWRLGERFGFYTRDQFVTAFTAQRKKE